MIRIAGEIFYLDGRVVEYEATQRELAAWERYALRAGLPTGIGTNLTSMVTMTRYVAYKCEMRGSESPVSFEVWDDSVAEVTAPDQEAEAADPTQEGRSAGSWPPSQ